MSLLQDMAAGVGLAYGAAAAARRAAYKLELLPVSRAPVPVISVGALACGGVGKTPVTRTVARFLESRGLRVGVVSGGYRGTQRRRVTRLTPDLLGDAGAVVRFGDEAVMLGRWLEGAVHVCGADKARAARVAASGGAEVVVIDDGFQHRRLHREVDIVVLDGGPLPAPLPAGPGRELPSALGAADLVWVHGRSGAFPRPAGLPAGRARVVSRAVATHLLDAEGNRRGEAGDLAGRDLFVISGIANPEGFRELLVGLGARVIGEVRAGDHCFFTRRQLRLAARSGAELVLCTEKDAVRMRGRPGAELLTALAIDLELERPGRCAAALEGALARGGIAC